MTCKSVLVPEARLELARAFLPKGFSYHYSFRYQWCYYCFFGVYLTDGALIINYHTLPLHNSNCLWSGLAHNHIEILRKIFLAVFQYTILFRTGYDVNRTKNNFNLGSSCIVSTHCLYLHIHPYFSIDQLGNFGISFVS